MTAIAIQHKETILEKLSSGMLLKEIAAELGVSKQALQRPLAQCPEYKAALEEQADALVEEAMAETKAARSPVDIARARELTKAAFRYAESIHARRWAPQSKVSIEVTEDLGDRLRRAKERVIEGEIVAPQQLPEKP